MGALHTNRRAERGAVVIQVAMSLLALAAFSALVADYGIMWVARGQSQNAADMGAHAGAVAMAFDADPEDSAKTLTRIQDISTAIAALNPVIGQAPKASTVSTSLVDCAASGVEDCVQFEVYRNNEKSNKLPVFFGSLFGSTGGGARAKTTVRNANGTGSDCLAPFVFPDKWRDVMDENASVHAEKWDPGKGFDEYCNKDKGCDEIKPSTTPKTYVYQWKDPFPNTSWDTYTAPSSSGSGTGYKFVTNGGTSDYGQKLDADDKTPVPSDLSTYVAKANPYGKSYLGVRLGRKDPVTGEWLDPIDPGVDSAGAAQQYVDNIKTCNGIPIFVGEELTYYPALATDTQTGTQFVFNSDPNAEWKDNKIKKSCVETDSCSSSMRPARNGMSPRVMDIALFDPKQFEDDRLCKNSDGSPKSGCTPKITLKITNIVGAFLNGKFDDLKDGKFKTILVPNHAVTCTPDIVDKKGKGKKGTFDCPEVNPESFTRTLTFWR